jgi:hypothetical protein
MKRQLITTTLATGLFLSGLYLLPGCKDTTQARHPTRPIVDGDVLSPTPATFPNIASPVLQVSPGPCPAPELSADEDFYRRPTPQDPLVHGPARVIIRIIGLEAVP